MRWTPGLAAPVVAVVLLSAQLAHAAETEGNARTTTATLRPATANALSSGQAPTEAREALRRRHAELRERVTARVSNRPAGGPPGRPEVAGRPVALAEASPSGVGISRNMPNPVASSEAGDTVAEPAAANHGDDVLYTGNTYASFSTNGGRSWAPRAIPTGPSDAPVPCCDQDVVHDPVRHVTFWSLLYLDEGLINGVVRIFVTRSIAGAPNCSYVVDPGGSANDLIPDYPHLAVSNGYLYLGTTNLRMGEWVASEMRRFPLRQMANCQALSAQTFSYFGPDQRVFVPAEGASSVAYWGAVQTPTSFIVFRWPERDSAPSSFVRSTSASTFENPDCRGGADDSEFVERTSAWSIAGFRLRGAVGGDRVAFYWNVGPDAKHPQGHVHAAVFDQRALRLVAQPHIYHPSVCIAYPAVGSNARAEFGLSVAAGGRRGGHGPAARGWVGIGRWSQTGISYTPFSLTAQGTHNPIDGRYGDYFTVRADARCPNAWVATNYSLFGGNFLPSHVNARYVEFGSFADSSCS